MIVIWMQKELAEYLGVSSEYIREIKTKRKRLSKKKQLLLKEFYQMKIEQLQGIIAEIEQNNNNA